MRPNPVKQALKSGQPSVGTWLSLGSITASRFLARCGFAWLTIDIEHILVDWETAAHMFASIADGGCTALARVPANRHDHIKRVLDNGAYGVVVPMVNSRAEAEAAVAACLYPPKGNRSVGGNQHALNFDSTAPDYYNHPNDEFLIVLQCEHIQSVQNADALLSAPGHCVFLRCRDADCFLGWLGFCTGSSSMTSLETYRWFASSPLAPLSFTRYKVTVWPAFKSLTLAS